MFVQQSRLDPFTHYRIHLPDLVRPRWKNQNLDCFRVRGHEVQRGIHDD
jgi:hypothetical protein